MDFLGYSKSLGFFKKLDRKFRKPPNSSIQVKSGSGLICMKNNRVPPPHHVTPDRWAWVVVSNRVNCEILNPPKQLTQKLWSSDKGFFICSCVKRILSSCDFVRVPLDFDNVYMNTWQHLLTWNIFDHERVRAKW